MRRIRVRSLTDDDLLDRLISAVVEVLLADEHTDDVQSVELARLHTEWVRRHRRSPSDECSCQDCTWGRWSPTERPIDWA